MTSVHAALKPPTQSYLLSFFVILSAQTAFIIYNDIIFAIFCSVPGILNEPQNV